MMLLVSRVALDTCKLLPFKSLSRPLSCVVRELLLTHPIFSLIQFSMGSQAFITKPSGEKLNSFLTSSQPLLNKPRS